MNLKNGMATAVVALAALCQPVFAGGLTVAPVAKGCDLINRGDYNGAVSVLTLAVRQNPSDLEARRYLCRAFIGAGAARQAVQQLEAVIKVAPNNPADYTMIAEAYFQMGDTKKSIAYYKQAIQVDSSYAGARLGLARAFLASGDTGSAGSVCYESLKTRQDAQTRQQFIDLINTIRSRGTLAQKQLNG
jgi:tetratricopeptide (TPR) repeat protein